MEFFDKNLTLEPPEGYTFSAVQAEGAYLRVEYRQFVYDLAQGRNTKENITTIYLNDMGREVARSMTTILVPQPEPIVSKKWWEKLVSLLP